MTTLHATVRVDPQGAWLEVAGERYHIDDHARAVWSTLDGAEVDATGAGPASRFDVQTLAVSPRAPGRFAYVSVGPLADLTGELVMVDAPAGSKAEGTSRLVFRANDRSYDAITDTPIRGAVIVRGRELTPDMSHHARASDRDLWIETISASPAR